MNAVASPHVLRMEFNSDWETAERIRDTLQVTLDAVTAPTRDTTGALLRLAVDTMMAQARDERDAA